MNDITKAPIRVVLFPERPGTLLVVAPEGAHEPVQIPSLLPPFVRAEVYSAFRASGQDVRITEEAAGRWSGAVLRTRREERCERQQRAKLADAAVASLAAGSEDPLMRDRGAALRRKQEVDEAIATLKKQVHDAKVNAATRGAFLPPAEFRRMLGRLEDLKVESQGLQVRLSELKKQEKARNIAEHGEQAVRFERRFLRAAKEVLDPEDFAELCEMAEEDGEAP